HETANEAPGADAEAHRRFVHAGGGREGVSFHFVVDDREAVQLLPTTEVGWHAGDGPAGPGNRTSLAVELCVHAGSDWERTQEHGARLVAALCRAFGIPLERVVPHRDWSGKSCPRRLLAAGFERFRARVAAASATARERFFPETGQWVRGDFLTFWEARGGLPLFGYPLTGERRERCEDGHEHWVQWFERACFERHEELGPGQAVLLRRLGALALARGAPDSG
ncbi:MAG: N-acetylmuramoyl-L-alanine amidase, partial [Dehalococcoidia bacterium]|nr:N-acetylmuramoyl-L-alanine amidase [Dehalococcoidia bacterium]